MGLLITFDISCIFHPVIWIPIDMKEPLKQEKWPPSVDSDTPVQFCLTITDAVQSLAFLKQASVC